MLNFGAAYVEQGQTYYEERYKDRLLNPGSSVMTAGARFDPRGLLRVPSRQRNGKKRARTLFKRAL